MDFLQASKSEYFLLISGFGPEVVPLFPSPGHSSWVGLTQLGSGEDPVSASTPKLSDSVVKNRTYSVSRVQSTEVPDIVPSPLAHPVGARNH